MPLLICNAYLHLANLQAGVQRVPTPPSPGREDGMADTTAWHSIKESVHHVCTNCNRRARWNMFKKCLFVSVGLIVGCASANRARPAENAVVSDEVVEIIVTNDRA